MVFLETGRSKNSNTWIYKVQNTEGFNKLPEDPESKSQFIASAFRPIQIHMSFGRNNFIRKRHNNDFVRNKNRTILCKLSFTKSSTLPPQIKSNANHFIQCQWYQSRHQ